MAMTETARRNHGKLFPNHKSTLQVTDPEFIEVFDNFAFDEVLSREGLDERTRMILVLGAIVASQALGEYRVMVLGALNLGVTPVEIKEIVYQAVPYLGIAKVFDFLHATNEAFKSRGIALPLEGQSTTTPATRREKGYAAQKAIFSDEIDRMRREAPADQAHIQEYLTANCFGDFYTRKSLDLKTRELLTFAFLVALGGCEPQVKGHVRGNLNVGNDRDVLLSVLTQLLPYVGYPRTLNGLRCVDEAAPAALAASSHAHR